MADIPMEARDSGRDKDVAGVYGLGRAQHADEGELRLLDTGSCLALVWCIYLLVSLLTWLLFLS